MSGLASSCWCLVCQLISERMAGCQVKLVLSTSFKLSCGSEEEQPVRSVSCSRVRLPAAGRPLVQTVLSPPPYTAHWMQADWARLYYLVRTIHLVYLSRYFKYRNSALSLLLTSVRLTRDWRHWPEVKLSQTFLILYSPPPPPPRLEEVTAQNSINVIYSLPINLLSLSLSSSSLPC